MSVGRKRSGTLLSPTQRAAVVKLGHGALPWINRAFGRKPACPSTWILSARPRISESHWAGFLLVAGFPRESRAYIVLA